MNNMKNNFRLLVVALGIIAVTPAIAQKDNVGIGTTKPDQSAVLDVSSSTKGLLMPRMSLQQRSSIQNPAQGLVVYQTDFLSGFYFYDGTEWKPMTSETKANSVADDASNWSKTGNAATTAANFIGTTDGQPLYFKVNGEASGFISPTGSSMFFGYRSGFAGSGASANLGLGGLSLESLTTGNSNTGLGYASLRKVTSGNLNLGIGGFTLNNLTTGGGNVAIGHGALVQGVGVNDNIAIGTDAMFSATSSGNVAVGKSAMVNLTTGGGNVAIGTQAGRSLTTGGSNVIIGNFAADGQTAITDKLYIANSGTTTPLVYGDFLAKFVAIGDVTASLAKRDGLAAQYGLLVQKGILTEKIKVATMSTTDWADYVFEKDYKVMSLEAVEAFVKENKHLPNVPTTSEMMANGSDLIKTDAKLLEKIEELTLYMIEMNKEIKALKAENAKLKK